MRHLLPLVVVGMLGCGGPSPTVRKMPSLDHTKDGGKCTLEKAAKPLVVEWPASERAMLESRRRGGPIPVRLSGCQLSVVRGCTVKGAYHYTAVSRQTERVSIRDADELYANIPVYGASLEGRLKSSGALNVSMQIVGLFEADSWHVTRAELDGTCAEATHVVAAMTTGAFELFTGVDEEAGAKVGVLGVGSEGKTSTKHEVLNRGGEEKSCAGSNVKDREPPNDCATVLRLETVPIGEVRAAVPTCGEGTNWDGQKCAASRSAAEQKALLAAQRRAAAEATNAGKADVAKAQQAGDPDFQRALLASAAVNYRRAADAWEALLRADPKTNDAYKARYWIADARQTVLALEGVSRKLEDRPPPPPEMVEAARRAVRAVIDDRSDDKYAEPARKLMIWIDKSYKEDGTARAEWAARPEPAKSRRLTWAPRAKWVRRMVDRVSPRTMRSGGPGARASSSRGDGAPRGRRRSRG